MPTRTAISRAMSSSRKLTALAPVWPSIAVIVVARSCCIEPGAVMSWLVNAAANALASPMMVEHKGMAKLAPISPMIRRGISSSGPTLAWMVSRPITMMAIHRNAST
jgi:hypothetical protein